MPTPDRTSLTEIIAAARSILEESGAAGLTMQAVAIRCGVRAPSLYKRIHDRDALMSAVAAAVVDDLGSRLESTATLQSEMQPHKTFEALADAYRAFAHEQPEGFRLMLTASAPLDALDRAAQPVVTASADLVGRADALHAARLFTAWATGFLQMELAGAFRLGGDVDDAFSYGIRHLLNGLAD